MNKNDDKFNKGNFNIDKKVKDILKEEINVVPDNINKAFDEAIEKGIKAKRKKSYKRISQIAAGFIAVALVFGFSVSPYARNVPILKNIYETFNRETYENYDKYASDINITKESKGISITINKVIYDGFDLEVFYTMESDKPLNVDPYFRDYKMKINGEEVSFGRGAGGEYIEDNKIFVGYINYGINSKRLLNQKLENQDKEVDIPDEFLLSLEINKLAIRNTGKTLNGSWDFDIPVSNEKLRGDVKEIDVNFDLSSILDGLTINKVITTPINTVIQGYNNYTGNNGLHFTIFDDKGRILSPKSGEGSGSATEDGSFLNYFSKNFKEIYDDTENITIIPSVWIFPETENTNDRTSNKETVATELVPSDEKLITIPLNLEGETKLKTDDGEDYGTITKVEVKEDRTYIHFKPTVGNYDIFEKIVDDNNDINVSYPVDNYYRNEQTNTRYNKETGEFIIEFTKPLIIDGNYSISYFDKSGSEVYFFDKVITVDVK